MLIATDITAGYPGRSVLRNVSLSLAPGEIVGLVGPNGSGKSTLLKCLARALPPSQGSVEIDSKPLYTQPARETAQTLAYAPQEITMPFAFTVEEMANLGGDARSDRLEQALAIMELDALRYRSLTALSGGERQRASLARVLALETPYLLLDEPTSHLDLRYIVALTHALQTTARDEKRGVLIVLHDLNLAARLADRMVLLSEGQIVTNGPLEEVLRSETLSRVYRTPINASKDTSGNWTVLPEGLTNGNQEYI